MGGNTYDGGTQYVEKGIDRGNRRTEAVGPTERQSSHLAAAHSAQPQKNRLPERQAGPYGLHCKELILIYYNECGKRIKYSMDIVNN